MQNSALLSHCHAALSLPSHFLSFQGLSLVLSQHPLEAQSLLCLDSVVDDHINYFTFLRLPKSHCLHLFRTSAIHFRDHTEPVFTQKYLGFENINSSVDSEHNFLFAWLSPPYSYHISSLASARTPVPLSQALLLTPQVINSLLP